MTFEDEFKVYDSVPASTLSVADQILYKGEHVEIHSIIDNGNDIEITGYSYEQDDTDCEWFLIPDEQIDLWMIV